MRFLFAPAIWIARLAGALGRALFLLFRGYNVVRLRIHGSLPDRRGAAGLMGALAGRTRGPTLLDVLIALDRARRDPRVSVVLVEIGPLPCGLARAEEVRDALAAVRGSGKEVWAYLEEGGLAEYLAALGASRITLAPAGSLSLAGIASEVTLLKGLLSKAGVEAHLDARGKYKSAREVFDADEMSPASREMTEALVGDLYEQLVSQIAAHRSLSTQDVRARLDEGPFRAEQAVAAALADGTGYPDTLEEELKERFAKYRPVSLGAYLSLSAPLARRGRGRPTPIALVEVSGHIKSGKSLPGADGRRATGSQSFLKELARVAGDRRVKAVLLRVDSPGGSGLASDLMWHALRRLQEKKPVVVSMSNVAASGGYFVAGLPGAPVLALDSTITGSIGVLAGKFSLAGLYEKLGLKKEIVSRGRRALYGSETRGYTAEELEKLGADLDAFYRDFVTKMAEGRGRTYEEIHAVAQGRVWTGRQAKEHALTDERGGLLAALAALRRQLELPDDAPLALTHAAAARRRLPIRWQWDFGESPLGPSALLEMGDALARPLYLARIFSGERLLALLPFEMRVK